MSEHENDDFKNTVLNMANFAKITDKLMEDNVNLMNIVEALVDKVRLAIGYLGTDQIERDEVRKLLTDAKLEIPKIDQI
jgi:hypothetical protein